MHASMTNTVLASRVIRIAIAAILIAAAFTTAATACPFCGEKTRTLSELFAESEYAVLAQWVSSSGADADQQTKYEIVQVVRDPGKAYKKGQTITFPRTIPGKSGDLSLVLGKRSREKSELAEWRDPIEVSEVAYQYILQAPPPEAPAEKRLQYFSKFLEYPDPLIGQDAYGEFSNSPYKDIVPIARKMDPAKLRKWIFDVDIKGQMRRGLYGMMLGLCGDASDADRLEAVIRENPTDDIRMGIDGMIGGYLLLKGADGLKIVEETKLTIAGIPHSETHAALTALRFMWTYAEGRIPADRLKTALRQMLIREDVAELAITDLARWKDWDIQNQLFKLYGSDGEYQQVRLKKAIINYLIASIRDVPKKNTPQDAAHGAVPEHARTARQYLDEILKQDPALVIENLALFRNWDYQEQLFKLFVDSGKGEEQMIKKKWIIRYMIASMRDVPITATDSTVAEKLPRHARLGREYIEKFRQQDPQLVAQVEKDLLVSNRKTPSGK